MERISALINGSPVEIAFDSVSVHVYNAFPVKDNLKSRGYRWNPGDKSWYIKPDSVEKELALLKNNMEAPAAEVKQKLPVSGGAAALDNLPESLTVTDLRNHIDRLLRNSIKGRVWIRGVIASEVKHYQWASYFDIRDEDENRNIYFRAEAGKREMELIAGKFKSSGVAEGLEKDLPVFALFEVKIPLKNVVDIRLKMVDVLPEYTQSRIKNQREITLDRLTSEGKIENQKRLVIPKLVQRIGLITSGQGTSIQDIMAGLNPCESRYEFMFADARMEGAAAPDSVIAAFNSLERHPSFRPDVIILARGGGSEQSLAVFNDYRICERLTMASVPVIAAIGHEKDLSAAELCAHHMPVPSTPSGVGKFFKERYVNLQLELSGRINELSRRFTDLCYKEEQSVRRCSATAAMLAGKRLVMEEQGLKSCLKNLRNLETMKVREQEKRVNEVFTGVTGRLRLVLKRGYETLGTETKRLVSEGSRLLVHKSGETEKLVASLDFSKRYTVADRLSAELRERAGRLVQAGRKVLVNSENGVVMKENLVKANDPSRILNKGFTLIYDGENRVVKTLKEFETKDQFTIAFNDGKAENLNRQEKK